MPADKSKRKPGAKRKDYRVPLGARLRKPQASCVLKTMPEDSQEALWKTVRDPDKTVEEARVYAAQLAGKPISYRQLSEWRAWYAALEAEDRLSSQVAAFSVSSALTEAKAKEFRRRATLAFMSLGLEKEDWGMFVGAGRLDLSHLEHESKVTGLQAQLERRDEELRLKKQALELAKGNFRTQIADILKNLTSPDAPAKLQALLELIDSL